MTKFIVKTVEIVFICLLAVILLAMSVALTEEFFGGTVAFLLGAVLLSCVIGGLVLFREKIRIICIWIKQKLAKVTPLQMMIILFMFSAVVKIFLIFLFNSLENIGGDMIRYYNFANQFAENGYITGEDAVYARTFQYTTIYGLILSPFAKMFGDDPKVLAVVLAVFHSLCMVLLFDILKKFIGKEIAFVTLFLYCVSPMGLIQTTVIVHENGLLALHVIAFWLYMKAFGKKVHPVLQVVLVLLASLVISIGKTINASGRVVVVSFAIFAVAKLLEGGLKLKKVISVCLVVACLGGCYLGANVASKAIVNTTVEGAKEKPEKWELPYSWPIYLGWNYEWSGMWNQEDRDNYDKLLDFKTKEESQEYQKKIISERLNEYTPVKVVKHLFNKTKVLFGSQTLTFGLEMGNSISLFAFNGAGGIIRKLITLINRIAFLILYCMIFISKIKSFKKNDYSEAKPHVHCQMVIIGVTLALLLFEVTPKYVSHLHILFFFILAMSAKGFFSENPSKFAKKSNEEKDDSSFDECESNEALTD